MDENKKHISDELLACYLEGKVTEEEKALVEASLAEDGEAMDDLMLTRTEMAYSEMIKRLVGEGILLDGFHSIGNLNIAKTGAAVEGIAPDSGDGGRQFHFFQAGAAVEGIFVDDHRALRNLHLSQIEAAAEQADAGFR